MKEYNGHKSWNQWNVSLWINNEEYIYKYAMHLLKIYSFTKAVSVMYQALKGSKTPDGATYNRISVRNALEGLK
jgi:hypothetical protein